MEQRLWTKEFCGMCLSSFFQYVVHYAFITALPVFVIDCLQGGDWQAGLVMTFFQIGAVSFRPLAGRWIDQFRKHTMLRWTLGLFLMVSMMYLGAGSLYMLLAVRLLHGAVFATGTTTVAAVAALVLPAERKGEGIGYFAVFTNLAMVVGPFFSLLLIAYYDFKTLFFCCAILALCSFGFGNAGQLPRQAAAAAAPAQGAAGFLEPKALPAALMGGLIFFTYAGVLVFSPLYTKSLSLSGYTSAFFAVFALTIVVTRPLVGRLFDRSGAKAVIYPGFILYLLGLLALSQVQSPMELLGAGVIVGTGFGALSPAFQTIAIQRSPEHRAGVATATYFLALDISVGLGSFFLSLLAGWGGYRTMYAATALMVAVVAILFHFFWQSAPKAACSE